MARFDLDAELAAYAEPVRRRRFYVRPTARPSDERAAAAVQGQPGAVLRGRRIWAVRRRRA